MSVPLVTEECCRQQRPATTGVDLAATTALAEINRLTQVLKQHRCKKHNCSAFEEEQCPECQRIQGQLDKAWQVRRLELAQAGNGYCKHWHVTESGEWIGDPDFEFARSTCHIAIVRREPSGCSEEEIAG